MMQGEGVTSYLMILSQVQDELVAIGGTFTDSEMVRIALKGFTPERKSFIKGIIARDQLLDWNRLWDDFIQEELRDEELHLMKKDFDDDVALAAWMKGKQKDLSKLKCFNCGEYGHYSTRRLKKQGDDEKKKGKQVAGVTTSTKIDDLSKRLESEDFAFISHFFEGAIDEAAWYVDSGASKHMTGSQDMFETLAEWDSKLHMVVGDKSQKEIRGSGIVPFRMELIQLMQVQDVLYVSKLRYNALSVSLIEQV